MGTRTFPTNFLCKKYHQKWRSEIRDQRWRWQRAINCLYAVYSARALPSNILGKKYRFPDLGKIIGPKDKEELSFLSGRKTQVLMTWLCVSTTRIIFHYFEFFSGGYFPTLSLFFCFYCTFSVPKCKTCSTNEENIIEKEALSKLRFVFHFGLW